MSLLQEASRHYRQRVDAYLEKILPAGNESPERLHQAMRYAVTNGGKRMRPLLVYAAGQALDIDEGKLDPLAAAVELIHAYSLVHDDLPAMDDDDLRRGKPTCHIAFDEAIAILAGDALQALAFEIIASHPDKHITDAQRINIIRALSHAAGSHGMCGGQALDLAATNVPVDMDYLQKMHRCKTGALIRSCVHMAAHLSPLMNEATYQKLDTYAVHVGLAFQIHDDVLDVTADTVTLGKTQGADQALNKSTYVSLLGLDEARASASRHVDSAIAALKEFGERAELLREVARYAISRDH